MNDIETRIKERGYQSPGRARAAIKMAKIKGKERTRLEELIDEWEGEGVADVVVAGVPVEGSDAAARPKRNGRRHPQMSGDVSGGPNGVTILPEGTIRNGKLEPMRLLPAGDGDVAIVVNLNARIRARLTPYGVSLLYAARSKVAVPEDLMARQGVWETDLWQFMIVMSPYLSTGDEAVTVGSNIELLSRGA